MSESIATYVEAHRERFLDDLRALVAIPSISTLSEHNADTQQAAEWLVDHLHDTIGLQNARLIATERHPLVYADWLHAPDQPTVLIYGHYDVQPVDPLELWHTPPFEATVEGENLRGRGASDDKGPTLAALKSIETLLHTSGKLPVNVRVLLEGEEESGGESIEAYVQQHADALKCDCVLVLDTTMQEEGVPTLCYALRGIVAFDITATGAAGDLHSGIYGGVAPNPIQALVNVLAEIKHADGSIHIPGLDELMEPISDEQRAAMEQQSAAETERIKAATGLAELVGDERYSVVERATARPTFEIHGIRGGFTGEGSKTVIPSTATAKISMRLVPGQQPAEVARLLTERVRQLTPPGVTIDVEMFHGGDAVLFDNHAPALQAAERALETEFRRPVAWIRLGASIPIVALFDAILRVPIVMMSFSLADDNFHAPNEKFYLPNYYAAIRSVAHFLEELGRAEG